MHIEKLVVTIFAVGVVGASSLQAQSTDTDVQAKMREALRQKIAELNGQDAGTNAPAPAPSAKAPAPSPIPAPLPTAPAITPTPSPMSGGLTPEQEAQVRAALHQATADMDAKQNPADSRVNSIPANPAPAPSPTPNPEPVAAPVQAVAPVESAPAPVGRLGALSPDDEARVRAALHQAEEGGTTAAPTPTAPVATTPAAPVTPAAPTAPEPAVQSVPPAEMDADAKKKEQQEIMARELQAERDYDAKQAEAAQKNGQPAKPSASLANTHPASTAPAPMPASMVPGSKEARLYDLLQQYKADRISPVEYHEQRAKILSEP